MCVWWGGSEADLAEHLGGPAHQDTFKACRETAECTRMYSNVDLYEEAITILEQEQVPIVGPSVDVSTDRRRRIK